MNIDPTSISKFVPILQEIHEAVKSLDFGEAEVPWFRGQDDASHDLLPSLFRPTTLKRFAGPERAAKMSTDQQRDALLRLESDVYFEFAAKSSAVLNGARTAWDTLFLMRHYGLPTRTLDWSETLGVSLFFAVGNLDLTLNRAAAIWILNPYALNGETWGGRDTVLPRFLAAPTRHDAACDYDQLLAYWGHSSFRFDGPVAVCPDRLNERMHAQAGSFTIHGNDPDAINLHTHAKNFVRKVEIPHTACEGAKAFLRIAGISERSLFPGLDGLSREMRARYG
ncbi:MAG TPA: FRG domain-containing protein [Phycisphaerales bacterium]